jgi:hypothetical protein
MARWPLTGTLLRKAAQPIRQATTAAVTRISSCGVAPVAAPTRHEVLPLYATPSRPRPVGVPPRSEPPHVRRTSCPRTCQRGQGEGSGNRSRSPQAPPASSPQLPPRETAAPTITRRSSRSPAPKHSTKARGDKGDPPNPTGPTGRPSAPPGVHPTLGPAPRLRVTAGAFPCRFPPARRTDRPAAPSVRGQEALGAREDLGISAGGGVAAPPPAISVVTKAHYAGGAGRG